MIQYLPLSALLFFLTSLSHTNCAKSQLDHGLGEEYSFSNNLVLRQNTAEPLPEPPCGFWITIDENTTCAQILSQWNLNSTSFAALNPNKPILDNGASDCIGVGIFGNYCVAPIQVSLSTDGKCGPKNGFLACPGSGFGDCCSATGWCGTGYAFCGIGNCIAGNCEGGPGWSTDGKCGPNANEPRCGGQFGVCCSNSGWCGNGTDYCAPQNCAAGDCIRPATTTTVAGTTCIAGACWTSKPATEPGTIDVPPTTSTTTTKVSTSSTKPPTTSSSKTSTTTSSTAAATPTSPDGSCGGTKKYTCAGTTFGNCCSSSGYCGKTGVFCGEGCQKSFSSGCQTTNVSSNNGRCGVVSGSATFTCVGGSFDGQCCSSGGYCGTTTGHCGTGCQKSYGRCS